MEHPLLQQALAQRDAVLRTFVAADGRITQMPAKRVKRLALLDHVAGSFEVGRKYSEKEVTDILKGVHHDHAALRRYLVDEGFLSRDHGVYWRSGGTVDL